MNLKLALANAVRVVTRFLATRSNADSDIYLRRAGIDVDGLRPPLQD